MSSGSVWMLSGRIFCCCRTAMRCPGEGRTGWSAAQHFAQHHLAGVGGRGQRAQKIAVETADLLAEHAVAERDLGLLDRVRDHDVEADHLGAAFQHSAEDAADLAGPGQHRRALERGVCRLSSSIATTTVGEADAIVPAAEHLPAQRGENDRATARGSVEPREKPKPRRRPVRWRRSPSVSRVLRPILKLEGPTRLFDPQQPADDRRRAGFGLRVHPEHDFRRLERRRIEAAGVQRDVLRRRNRRTCP